MIKLESQYITQVDDKSRLNFDYTVDGVKSTLWFEVDREYEQYLCTERCDAFEIGALPFALKNNHDIISNTPITEELSYKLNVNLIPTLCKFDKHIFNIKVKATQTSEKLPNAGAYGTGVSGGIDSFHSILNGCNSDFEDMRLTHLCIFNVGSFGGNQRYRGDIREAVIERGKLIANEFNLPLIIANSNFADLFPSTHEYTHDFNSIFAICCLQKLWKAYYYASSNTDINVFSILNSSRNDSDEYALLLYYCFNNYNLNIISEGLSCNRLEKTAVVANSPIAQKYLHVCVHKKNNCGKCSKCMRTILSLDALGKLEDFSNVFDVEYYKKNKYKYYWFLFEKHYRKDPMMEPIYEAMKRKIPLHEFLFYKIAVALKHFIYDETYPERKKYIKIRVLGISIKLKKK